MHVLVNGDILYVPDAPKSTKELLLYEDGAGGDHSVGSPLYDGDNVVCLRVGVGGEHGFEMGPVGLGPGV